MLGLSKLRAGSALGNSCSIARRASLNLVGVADFDDLHSQKHNDEVQLYAFDLLAIDGDDLRELPLHLRKNHLSRLLARCVGAWLGRCRRLAKDFEATIASAVAWAFVAHIRTLTRRLARA